MSRHIADGVRKFIAERAGHCCEYCRFSEYYSFWSFQVDHIISLKHGGSSSLENLAWSCFPCNNHKGSDIGTILMPNQEFVRFYNPRIDNWADHFHEKNYLIIGKTQIGEGTIKILSLNAQSRISERRSLG